MKVIFIVWKREKCCYEICFVMIYRYVDVCCSCVGFMVGKYVVVYCVVGVCIKLSVVDSFLVSGW